MPGWKQPGPEGPPQKPGGQVQVFPSQCSMTAGPPSPDELDPTAQALSGEVSVTAVRVPAAGLGTVVQTRLLDNAPRPISGDDLGVLFRGALSPGRRGR